MRNLAADASRSGMESIVEGSPADGGIPLALNGVRIDQNWNGSQGNGAGSNQNVLYIQVRRSLASLGNAAVTVTKFPCDVVPHVVAKSKLELEMCTYWTRSVLPPILSDSYHVT